MERPMHPSTKALAPTHTHPSTTSCRGSRLRTEHRRAGPCRAPIQRIATLPRADPTAPRPPASSPHLRTAVACPSRIARAGRAATATPPPSSTCPDADADAIFSASPAQRRQPPVARESFGSACAAGSAATRLPLALALRCCFYLYTQRGI